jgi:hypothetical protein
MTLSLTCACGARLEIDERFAGQQIHCPDCQRPLQAPAAPTPATTRRTSGLALCSLLLALVGAFTILGTVVAVLLGVAALLQIANRPDRLAGRGYALAGIVLGVVLTAGTLFAVTSVELFGLTSVVSGAHWTGKLDFDGPMEIVRTREGFAVKRPSEKWGVYKHKTSGAADNDPAEFVWRDLLLVLPSEDAVVLCFAVRLTPRDKGLGIEGCTDKALVILKEEDKLGLFVKGSKGTWPAPTVTKRPPSDDGLERRELQIDRRSGGEDKTFLIRVYKRRGDDRFFVLVAGARRTQFSRLEPQLREVLDSFRVLDHDVHPNW